MPNMNLEKLVIEALAECIFKLEEFTAYDITTDIRNTVGPDVSVAHNDVNRIVQQIYNKEMPYYKRTMKDMGLDPAESKKAWIYHPEPYASFVPGTTKETLIGLMVGSQNIGFAPQIPDAPLRSNVLDIPVDNKDVRPDLPIYDQGTLPMSTACAAQTAMDMLSGKYKSVVATSLFDDEDIEPVKTAVPPITSYSDVELKDERDLSDDAKEKLKAVRAYYAAK
jgi:hypothetical protein